MEDDEMVTLESVQLPQYREAYDELRPLLGTLPTPPRRPVECNVPALVSLVLRLWPALAAHKNRLVLARPDFDPEELERLKRYALALGHAHGLYVGAGAALADCLSGVEQAQIFSERCRQSQDSLLETGRYRNLLLFLLDGAYARVRNAVVTLRNASPEVASQFPEFLERP
jgi:hypothetical protein